MANDACSATMATVRSALRHALWLAVTRDAFPEVLVGKLALAKASVNLSEAARILGVSRSTLYRMIERTRNAWPQALTVRFIC